MSNKVVPLAAWTNDAMSVSPEQLLKQLKTTLKHAPCDGIFVIGVNRGGDTFSLRWWCAGLNGIETTAVLSRAFFEKASGG